MSFIFYDIAFLVLFAIFVSIFLYSRRKKLEREGLLFLYKTSWGIKLINYVGDKYKRTLKFLGYISVGVGYILMATMIYLFWSILKIYIFRQDVVQAIKIPPIMPLIPYLPRIFNLDFLPPFYFIYWIIILAVIAITHEFAHGIFARYNKVKIKSTGFGFFPFFLPVFLAAFVEQDEKDMLKAKKFKQMVILSAGTFANVLTAIFFFIIIVFFFSLAFTPSGIMFDSYSYSVVEIAGISVVNGISLDSASYEKVLSLAKDEGFTEIKTDTGNYITTKEILEGQKDNKGIIMLYDDAPAINIGLNGAITEINNIKINSIESLGKELSKYSPGEKIIIKTIFGENISEQELILGEHPGKENSAWLGVGFYDKTRSGISGKIYTLMSSFKKPNIYYEPNFEASLFIYDLLWWLVLISISVALVNMLPIGIFDGGRFFYLTVLAITKSEKISKKTFSLLTYFFLLLLFVIMFFWVISFF